MVSGVEIIIKINMIFFLPFLNKLFNDIAGYRRL